MSAKAHILVGPARSGKTAALVERYRQALIRQSNGGELGSALWIAPTQRAASEIRGRLVAAGTLEGIFSPGVCTFWQFADGLLAESDQPMRPIGKLLKRQLIERLLARRVAAEQLEHFGPIAGTAGLIDLISGLIADLKRQEVSPADFSAKTDAVDPSAKNRELAAIYAEYERTLSDHQFYDAEGRFGLARDALRAGRLGPYSHLKLAVVDGFTDFTRTQQEILQLLERKATKLDELLISLPLEQEPGREDLFHKPRQTLQELQTRHRGAVVEWQPRQNNDREGAVAQLERRLFGNSREASADTATNGEAANGTKIEIVGTAGQLAEIELLARRVKRWLVHGDCDDRTRRVRPEEIVVVFRTAEASAALVEEVFNQYGIPAAIENRAALNRSPLLQALVGLIRVAADDWPYRQVLAVLSNNYFQPAWPQWQNGRSAGATEWAVRQLQVPRGQSKLLAALEWRSKAEHSTTENGDDQEVDETDVARQQEHRQRFGTALALLSKLANTLDKAKGSRTLLEWIGVVQGLAANTGLLDVAEKHSGVDTSDPQRISRLDLEAWKRLRAAMAASNQLEEQLNGEPAVRSPQEFLKWLLDVLATEPFPSAVDEVGRVRVLSAQSARALEIPYLFLAGLSEKSFPPPVRDDRIYSEAECKRLNQAGLQFVDLRQRGSEEMLLFYEVITRATRQLTLSYPALDEKAQPLLVSPYLLELERCAPDCVRHAREISLSPVPQHELLCSPAEERVRAVAELAVGKPKRLAGLLLHPMNGAAASANILNGLRATALRKGKDFGAFDGLLAGEATKKQLAKEYGAEHCWSVSRLEEYALCPYRFYLHNVLRLEELPELALEIDYGGRGSLAHDALAHLHRKLNEAGAPRLPADAGEAGFNKLTDETFAVMLESLPKGSPLELALRTIDLRLIAEWMKQYFGQHQGYDASGREQGHELRPAHFEVSFGLKGRGRGKKDTLSTETPFELACGEETIRFSGRIDRIDIAIMGDQVVFNILDYKTGRKKKLSEADLQAGLALQLPIYAMAVQELLMIDRRAKPWRVGYWYLKDKGFESHALPAMFEKTEQGIQETEAWRELRGKLLGRILSLVQGVRGGMFPVSSLDDNCTARCTYRTVCRVGQARAADKAWPPGSKLDTETQEAKTS